MSGNSRSWSMCTAKRDRGLKKHAEICYGLCNSANSREVSIFVAILRLAKLATTVTFEAHACGRFLWFSLPHEYHYASLQTLQTDKETEAAHHEDEVNDLVERQNTELQETGEWLQANQSNASS